MPDVAERSASESPRHAAFVRVTHWLTVFAFFALLVSGLEIVLSHPRFYWGEVGNLNVTPLFTLPVPVTRNLVPTGYSFRLVDQNGWSRSLHFEAAWAAVLTGIVYARAALRSGHFRSSLLPTRSHLTWSAVRGVIASHLRLAPPDASDAHSYNVLQRVAYLSVIVILFPLMLWSGLALSPGFAAAAPLTVEALGGRQSARTIHFLVTGSLVLFLGVHVAMVAISGFRNRMRAMITGLPQEPA